MASRVPLFIRGSFFLASKRTLGKADLNRHGCRWTAGSAASAPHKRLHSGLGVLRRVLDEHIVGQSAVKEALLLGLLAREHVYIEGPPGVAKTFTAELISECTNLSHWFYQMHRDTRLNEIIGEAVIAKETTATGEIIRQDTIHGGILTCELAVLDDISRAPGEALNVLLRILNERKYGTADRIPLLLAIATGNPAQGDAYYAEPLDPATLDRFTLQLKVQGHINGCNWAAASEVIDMYSGASPSGNGIGDKVSRELLMEAGDLVSQVFFGESTKEVLLELLRVLREEYNLGEENALLTDRTFLIKAIKILKAQAALHGRQHCQPQDLHAMRYLTTFRVPTEVHEQIDQIIAEILAKQPPPDEPPTSQASGSETHPGTDSSEPLVSAREASDEEPCQAGSSKGRDRTHSTARSEQHAPEQSNIAAQGDVSSLDTLLRALKGHFDRGAAVHREHPGGLPRSYEKLRSFTELMDADPISVASWCKDIKVALPRSPRRTRPRLGGNLVIMRDTSLSMQGPWSTWSSLLCPLIVGLAKQHKMRVGYLVFNDTADMFTTGKSHSFFSHEYEALAEHMAYAQCMGCTNYELPLSIALSEFNRVSGKRSGLGSHLGSCKQHILFLTDGQPTSGDREVRKQIRDARRQGIAIHTVFVGHGECPPVLDRMSLCTNGSRFAARRVPGTVTVEVTHRCSATIHSGKSQSEGVPRGHLGHLADRCGYKRDLYVQ